MEIGRVWFKRTSCFLVTAVVLFLEHSWMGGAAETLHFMMFFNIPW